MRRDSAKFSLLDKRTASLLSPILTYSITYRLTWFSRVKLFNSAIFLASLPDGWKELYKKFKNCLYYLSPVYCCVPDAVRPMLCIRCFVPCSLCGGLSLWPMLCVPYFVPDPFCSMLCCRCFVSDALCPMICSQCFVSDALRQFLCVRCFCLLGTLPCDNILFPILVPICLMYCKCT
jgi:hypothetical protein